MTGPFGDIMHAYNCTDIPLDDELAYALVAEIFAPMRYRMLGNGTENTGKAFGGLCTADYRRSIYIALMDSLTKEQTVEMNPVAPLEET